MIINSDARKEFGFISFPVLWNTSVIYSLSRNQVVFICYIILLCYLVLRETDEQQKGNEELSVSYTLSNVITQMWKTCCSELKKDHATFRVTHGPICSFLQRNSLQISGSSQYKALYPPTDIEYV